jgi:hypothetical protein
LRADDRAGRGIRNAQNQVPTALVGERDAVLAKPRVFELTPSLLELKVLCFARNESPSVDSIY